MERPERRVVRLTIPARAEYITLCRLALTGLARLRPISRGARRRPEARADRGVLELGAARVRPSGDGTSRSRTSSHADRLVIEVVRRRRGLRPDGGRRRSATEDAHRGRARHRDHPRDRRRVRDRARPGGRGSRLRFVKRPRPPSRAACCSSSTSATSRSRDYASLATRGLMDEIRALAEPLAGKRVLHLSATAFGGGVAEINYTLVPLMQDAGLEVEWRIIRGADEFFNVTKTIHNALQGDPHGLTPRQQRDLPPLPGAERARARPTTTTSSSSTTRSRSAMIDHFPRVEARSGSGAATSTSRRRTTEVLDFLLPSIARYDAAIFHLREYVPRAPGCRRACIWPPAIDPLAPKNMALSPEDAAYIVDQFGIDVERPLLTQVSRFDPWKDPLGVIDAYRLVKEQVPGRAARARRLDGARRSRGLGLLQPDRRVRGRRSGHLHPLEPEQRRLGRGERVPGALDARDPEVDPRGLRPDGDARRSGRRGPTVAGRVGGIVAQIEDGETGWLVDSSEECAAACLEILRDPARRAARALRGKEHVRTALPDAAAAARLARALQPARRARTRGAELATVARSSAAPGIGPGVAARRKLIVVSNRGPVTYARERDGERVARRGGGGLVTALRSLVLAPRRDVDRERDDRRGSRRRRGRRRRGFEETARDGSPYRLRLVAHDPQRVRLVLQRRREPDALVPPALPVGPRGRAEHRPRPAPRVERRLRRR